VTAAHADSTGLRPQRGRQESRAGGDVAGSTQVRLDPSVGERWCWAGRSSPSMLPWPPGGGGGARVVSWRVTAHHECWLATDKCWLATDNVGWLLTTDGWLPWLSGEKLLIKTIPSEENV
jgi:hypothetical protein